MNAEERLQIEERIIAMLKTVYDPEIPVNIYDLGLIYKIDLQDDGEAIIDMTLTAPNCPAAVRVISMMASPSSCKSILYIKPRS